MDGGFDGFSAPGETPKADDAVDAERALLASVFHDDDGSCGALDRTATLVSAEDFADPRRAAMWQAMLDLRARKVVVDAGTVAEELGAKRADAAVKHMGDVQRLAVAPASCETHAKRVAEHALNRAVSASLRDALDASRGAGSPLERVGAARAIVAKMPADVRGQRDDSIHAGMDLLMEEIEVTVAAARKGAFRVAQWGVGALDGWFGPNGKWIDGALGGLFPGELFLLGGVPASGKTSLAIQAALTTSADTAKAQGRRVLYFTLEMPRSGICRRLVAQKAGIASMRIKRGMLTPEEVNELGKASQEFGRLKIDVIESCQTTEAITSRVLAERSRGDVGLVVVDFLQRVSLPRKSDSATHDDQERVYAMKGLSTAAMVPVLAITSMTKTGQRDATAGNVDMTGASGSGLEYAADGLGFLVRADPKDKSDAPLVRMEVVKSRDGVPETPQMRFEMKRGRFVNA